MENFSNKIIDIHRLPQCEEVEFYSISGKQLIKSFIETGISLLFFLIIWMLLFYFEIQLVFVLPSLVLIILFFTFSFWNTYKMQDRYGYAFREKDLLYRRGFIVNRTTVVPFNRIQHATISRGILDKLLGISTLNIFTAGGSGSDIQIPGLQPDLALRLKESLAAKISEDEI